MMAYGRGRWAVSQKPKLIYAFTIESFRLEGENEYEDKKKF